MGKTVAQLQCELRMARQREEELRRSNENLQRALMRALEYQQAACEEMGRTLKAELKECPSRK